MEGIANDSLVSRPEAKPEVDVVAHAISSSSTEDKGPVSLSFPSILRNPGLTSRYAHLVQATGPPSDSKKVWRRNDNEGKRWIRRRENAHFTDNPHIAIPSKHDLELSLPTLQATFPIPLPPYLPRSTPLPATVPSTSDAKASNAGQFSLSLRGMRKALRRAGPRTQALVRGVEDELTRWLSGVEIVLNPPSPESSEYQFPGRAIVVVVGGQECIREIERSPQQLVWWIENDTWARYIVHCCARYHNIVSFSKDTPTHRLTHILRPNATRPDPSTGVALATPPTTDIDFTSALSSSYDSDHPSSLLSDVQSIDGGSDVLSESDFGSDVEPVQYHRRASPLSDIASDVEADVEETVSAIGGGGVGTGGGSGDVGDGGDSDLEQATEALSLVNDDGTPRPPRRTAAYNTRATIWDPRPHARSGSSPSRSPARRKPRRPIGRVAAVAKKRLNNEKDKRRASTTIFSNEFILIVYQTGKYVICGNERG
ncbi:hypothetical protein B0F90DRAFT_1811406 [Multifurca ochricompacta]|uniref:Uncharacterized protein n=1 Tax=Multifurca ochricompacta TaxID=376703 RepID=A0AAD4M169_9AGAM|nr:hypothetical protein B0F90DRAFT_1811406 [Multifurca ochricompacta]